jgi:hypothetical protein
MNNELTLKSADRKLFKQFTIRYGIALTFIAVLSIVSQVRIQQHLNRSMDDSHVINFAARLRTYSQTLCKAALLLQNNYDYENSRKDFVNTLKQWEKAQEGVEAGSKFLNLPKENMEEIKEMFDLINRPRQEMVTAAEHIYTILDTAHPFDPEVVRPHRLRLRPVFKRTHLPAQRDRLSHPRPRVAHAPAGGRLHLLSPGPAYQKGRRRARLVGRTVHAAVDATSAGQRPDDEIL